LSLLQQLHDNCCFVQKQFMIANSLITDEIPPLKTSDSALLALQWMEEFKVSHLPIVNYREYLGIISDSEIMDMNSPDKAISEHRISLLRPFVFEDDHIYEVIKLVNTLQLTIVPVLTRNNEYLGAIPLSHLVQSFAKMASLTEAGGVIVLELNSNDYSLTQIAGIVEGNDAKILSLYISSAADSTKMDVTIKVNRTDLAPILQTFYRYNYVVKASFNHLDYYEEAKQRFDSFMNYLNI
jgi:acetoin utilization protein AcuB